MKSRFPKPKIASSITTATRRSPRKRISLPPIESITSRVAQTQENISSIANLFSTEEIHQLIEKKAYEIFEMRGYAHGHDLDDWLEAEKIIKAELNLI